MESECKRICHIIFGLPQKQENGLAADEVIFYTSKKHSTQ